MNEIASPDGIGRRARRAWEALAAAGLRPVVVDRCPDPRCPVCTDRRRVAA